MNALLPLSQKGCEPLLGFKDVSWRKKVTRRKLWLLLGNMVNLCILEEWKHMVSPFLLLSEAQSLSDHFEGQTLGQRKVTMGLQGRGKG